jgi:hypothetical protein
VLISDKTPFNVGSEKVFLCTVYKVRKVVKQQYVHNGFESLCYSKSATFNRQRMEELSHKTGKVLLDVQQQAVIRGNKVQLEQMKQRLNASQTWTQKATDEAQETSSGDVQSTPHTSNTSEPYIIVVPDTETQEFLELRKWAHPTLEYLRQMPHSLERDSKDPAAESTSPNTLSRRGTDIQNLV